MKCTKSLGLAIQELTSLQNLEAYKFWNNILMIYVEVCWSVKDSTWNKY